MTTNWYDAPYAPSTWEWVREQVEEYEASGGTRANTLRDTGLAIIIVWTKGRRSGLVRKSPLMRVEHHGAYALVGSKGGAPEDPEWVANLRADPAAVRLQDGPAPWDAAIREIDGEEWDEWWERCVAAFPTYADYRTKTSRTIPIFIATER